jgi:hypothetical protein
MPAMPRICFQASHKHLPYLWLPASWNKIVQTNSRNWNSSAWYLPRPFADRGPDTCLNNSMLGTVPWYVKVPGYTGLSYTVSS